MSEIHKIWYNKQKTNNKMGIEDPGINEDIPEAPRQAEEGAHDSERERMLQAASLEELAGESGEGDLKIESSREYKESPVIRDQISRTRVIFEKPITSDTKVCLIGDGQGLDTKLFLEMGVDPSNISSINYEQSEVDEANAKNLRDTGVEMKQCDATSIESIYGAGIEDKSQNVVTLMHVLEVPNIKDETEKQLVRNIARILKPNGELLVTQYKKKLTPSEAEEFGVEAITADDLRDRFGDGWKEQFESEYGQEWFPGMRYSEISQIRSKEELLALFADDFEIKIEEMDSKFILRMKKKTGEIMV